MKSGTIDGQCTTISVQTFAGVLHGEPTHGELLTGMAGPETQVEKHMRLNDAILSITDEEKLNQELRYGGMKMDERASGLADLASGAGEPRSLMIRGPCPIICTNVDGTEHNTSQVEREKSQL